MQKTSGGGPAKVYALLDYEADGDALISVHATEESANKAKELVAPIRCWIQECDVVAPPPQDGQGTELLGPPSKAEREVATATDGPGVRARLQAIYDSHPYEHETTIEGYIRLQNQVESILESLDTPSDGQRPDLADSAEHSAGYNECLYCREPVQAPALYCCEEHEEGRRME